MPRILSDILLIFSLILLPWWVTLFFAIVLSFFYESFFELILIGLFIDSLYAPPGGILSSPITYTLLCLGVFLFIRSVRTRMRLSDI